MVEYPDITERLSDLVKGVELSTEHAADLFERLLSGDMDDAQIGAVLALLQARGVRPGELLGAAQVMRRHVTPVPYTPAEREALIDTCGTGGAAKTFNISTAAAIVAASATPDPGSGIDRVVVAKHGNRSRTGRGSAEVIAELGINVDADPRTQATCLREVGVCFCFAIHHHPAMRHAVGPRRSLGFPTIFNLLGPLTNPAGASRQVIGVYRPEFVGLVAETLVGLGARSGVVLHSRDGMDEISIGDPTDAAWIAEGRLQIETINPRQHGLSHATPDQLRAGDVAEAARCVRRSIDGSSTPHSEVVAINAAAALVVAGASASLADGLDRAREAIASGRASRTLEDLARVSSA